MHAAVGPEGRPLAISFTGANVHDAPAAEGILEKADFRGGLCLADKAYVSAKIRDLVSASGGALNAPPKAGMKAGWDFDPSPYRGRNVVERFFGRIKEFRRFATRYDKLLSTYAMFAHLAIIVIFGIRIRA